MLDLEPLKRSLSQRSRLVAAAVGSGMSAAAAEEGGADFIVVDRDPYAGPPEDLLRVQVMATVVDGRVRYAQGSLAGIAEEASS